MQTRCPALLHRGELGNAGAQPGRLVAPQQDLPWTRIGSGRTSQSAGAARSQSGSRLRAVRNR
ncbi:hypothetical protein BKE38_00010 [Pseudoroseomonas deserti]|uniref:Uncharacterized protein n=1 Tax=Teichococcus deserti TaxID=1817963 RepID=A0A1V2H902_9PROT|nr:hypothetical protein BKE38_00010 [Pseudoroseomonas deserti]